jgi:hypothetical protein
MLCHKVLQPLSCISRSWLKKLGGESGWTVFFGTAGGRLVANK